MTRAPPHGTRFELLGGQTLAVEVEEGLVQLVTRDNGERVLSGVELTPSEAHKLGELIVSAAFHSKGVSAR